MTGLEGLWPTWAIPSVTRPWGISSSVMSWDAASFHPQEDDHLERIYPCAHGHAGGDRFLHDRGVALVRDGVVRYVLGSLRRSVDDTGRTHDGLTHWAMDTPDLSVVVRLACVPRTHDRRGPGARMVRVYAV